MRIVDVEQRHVGRCAVGQDLAWLLGWAVVLLVAAGRVFRWD